MGKKIAQNIFVKDKKSVWSKSKTCIFLGSRFSTSSCFVLSCLFRRMTCFWVLWPCNPDGCIHINKRISETLMSLKMENQWLALSKWEIFSLICGQLTSILNNQANCCERNFWHFFTSWAERPNHLVPLKLLKPLRLEAECLRKANLPFSTKKSH